eukprot:9089853-Pyramimonas_sp.AAC.1
MMTCRPPSFSIRRAAASTTRQSILTSRRFRAMCAASHSRFAIRSADEEKIHVGKTNVDVAVFFWTGRTGGPA